MFRSEALRPQHKRSGFSCGVLELDTYFQRQAGQDVRKRVAAVFVLTPDGATVAGYYTLSQYSLQLAYLPPQIAGRLPRYPTVPATLIGRLAVSLEFRGLKLGELLLLDALDRAVAASEQVASAAVVVDAKNDHALAFYEK